MEGRLNNYTHRALNFPSRLTLVKVVLQVTPSYVFLVLVTLMGMIKKIRAIQRNFLWGCTKIKQKWDFVNWETMCRPKRAGGLGLRDPEVINKVLSAKIWWRWVINKGEPWANFWHQKYARGWLSKKMIRLDQNIPRSPIWQAANVNRHLIIEHIFWNIGDGKEANFFRDSWQQMPKIQE